MLIIHSTMKDPKMHEKEHGVWKFKKNRDKGHGGRRMKSIKLHQMCGERGMEIYGETEGERKGGRGWVWDTEVKNQRAKNKKMRWKLKKKEGEDRPRVKRDRTHPESERQCVVSKVDNESAWVISLVFFYFGWEPVRGCLNGGKSFWAWE